MTFGEAIEQLKIGKNVTRQEWTNKEIYLRLIQGHPVNGHLNSDSPLRKLNELSPDGTKNITQGKAGQMLSHIVMKLSGDSKYWGAGYSDYVSYTPSQIDILEEDWKLIED